MITVIHENDKQDVPMTDNVDDSEHEVLVRCTSHDRTKFSTRVNALLSFTVSISLTYHHQIPASRLPEFHLRYGSLLKSSMAPCMRKRDKKREKARAEVAVKKRRELYVDVEIGNEGKRGKGKRRRVCGEKLKASPADAGFI